MTTARRLSPRLRTDRLESGRRRLARDLVLDLGVRLEGVGDEHAPWLALAEGGTHVVTVPTDFVTDFSSIPGFARWAYRFDKVDLAGCCHDLAYRIGVPRDAADELWRIVATSGERKVSGLGGRIGWLGLRVGGWYAYAPTGDPRSLPSSYLVDGPELQAIQEEELAELEELALAIRTSDDPTPIG